MNIRNRCQYNTMRKYHEEHLERLENTMRLHASIAKVMRISLGVVAAVAGVAVILFLLSIVYKELGVL